MSVIVLLIVAGGVVAAGFLAAFAWAVRSGQFDDMSTPAVRVLFDESRPSASSTRSDRRVVRKRAGRPSAGGGAPAQQMEDAPHVHARR